MNKDRNLLVGILAAISVTLIWSGWVVVSRYGVTHNFTIYDISVLRYGLAGLIILPFVKRWWPYHIHWWQALLLSTGVGIPYALLAFGGMSMAPTAHAGVIMNGGLPIAVAVLTALWLKQIPSVRKAVGMLVILLGCILIAFDRENIIGANLQIVLQGNLSLGHLMFLGAALLLAFYMTATNVWKVTPLQSLAVMSSINGAIIIPLWYFFLPSNLEHIPFDIIAIQAIYQAVGPSILGLLSFQLAIWHLGHVPVSAIMAWVPTCAVIIAIPVLNEWPSMLAWAGVVVTSFGILTTVLVKDKKKSIQDS